MSPYYLRSIHLNTKEDVVEDVFETEMQSLVELTSLSTQPDCVLAEIEWWKDNQPMSLSGVVLIAQAIRTHSSWKMQLSPLISRTRGVVSHKLLTQVRANIFQIPYTTSNIVSINVKKPHA